MTFPVRPQRTSLRPCRTQGGEGSRRARLPLFTGCQPGV